MIVGNILLVQLGSFFWGHKIISAVYINIWSFVWRAQRVCCWKCCGNGRMTWKWNAWNWMLIRQRSRDVELVVVKLRTQKNIYIVLVEKEWEAILSNVQYVINGFTRDVLEAFQESWQVMLISITSQKQEDRRWMCETGLWSAWSEAGLVWELRYREAFYMRHMSNSGISRKEWTFSRQKDDNDEDWLGGCNSSNWKLRHQPK